jgi:hypothetical protein
MGKGTKGTALNIAPPPTKPKGTKGSPVHIEPSANLSKKGAAEGVLINFRVSPEFRREFKAEAVDKDISMTELLYRAYDLYKKANK